MTPLSLEYLLSRFADRTISPSEKEELMKRLQMPEEEEAFHRAISKMLEEREPRHELTDETAAAILKAIFQSEGDRSENLQSEVDRVEGDLSERYQVATRSRPVWPRWAAAAACVVLVAGLGYLLWPKPHIAAPGQAVHPAAPSDVAPGSNKATLTLADGTRIDLDTAGNGRLSTGGEALVRKTANGQLTYRSLSDESQSPDRNEHIFYNTLSTPKGGQYRLVLSDGSQVWLNAASSITFPTAFTGKERTVRVTGEAYFEVAKNPSMPFIVQENGMKVQVLGTHFNVNGYDDEREKKVTLLEGRVKIVTEDSRTAFLRPGQQADLGNNGSLTIEDGVNLDEAVAWKNGLFDFDSTDIQEVMLQLARWYDVEIQYPETIPDTHYTGSIVRSVKLSRVLDMLEMAGEVRFTIEGKKIVLNGNKTASTR